MLFFGAVIFTHIFIDAFNNYGVGWFEPFNHRQISFNAIYVTDPFLSIWPGNWLAKCTGQICIPLLPARSQR
jgi:membrane-bound metal-dependent hydrolase YbcI (DUF457 family)